MGSGRYPSTGGGLSPADQTKLDGLPGPWTTVGPTVGDVQDLTIATGLDGSADGGYEIEGYPAALAGAETFFLRPNNVDTSCYSGTGVLFSASSLPGFGATNLRIISASTGDTPVFRCRIGGARTLGGNAISRPFIAQAAEGSDPAANVTVGAMTGSTNITSLVIHGSSADSIKAGSVFRWRKLNGS